MKYKAKLEDVALAAHVLTIYGVLAQNKVHGHPMSIPKLEEVVWLGTPPDAAPFEIVYDPEQDVVVEEGEFTFKDVEGREHRATAYATTALTPDHIRVVYEAAEIEILPEVTG